MQKINYKFTHYPVVKLESGEFIRLAYVDAAGKNRKEHILKWFMHQGYEKIRIFNRIYNVKFLHKTYENGN